MIEGAVADFEQRETDREPINMLIPSNFGTIPSVFYPSPNWFICFVTSVFSRLYLQRASGNFGEYGACFFFFKSRNNYVDVCENIYDSCLHTKLLGWFSTAKTYCFDPPFICRYDLRMA